jgi:hypothetical protein
LSLSCRRRCNSAGRTAGGKTRPDILVNVRIFLNHGADWRKGGEPLVVEFREEAEKIEPPGAVALGESAKLEVEAWQLAFAEDWIRASQNLEEAARIVGKGREATRGYRGLLLYIAGVWLHLGAESEAHRARARQLLRDAEKVSSRGTWLKEMKDLRVPRRCRWPALTRWRSTASSRG